eukprot:6207492-Pleurochrysis_carterae.AAC.1
MGSTTRALARVSKAASKFDAAFSCASVCTAIPFGVVMEKVLSRVFCLSIGDVDEQSAHMYI